MDDGQMEPKSGAQGGKWRVCALTETEVLGKQQQQNVSGLSARGKPQPP